MNISFTNKILFSFILVTFLGILGNLFVIIKFGNIELTTKSILEIQTALFTISEMKKNIRLEEKLINYYKGKADTVTYNRFVRTTHSFNRLVKDFRFKTFWADNNIRRAMNRIINNHNDVISKFNSRALRAKYFKTPMFMKVINRKLGTLHKGFSNLISLLNNITENKLTEVDRATRFMDSIVIFLLFFTSFVSIILCVFITKSILVPFRKLLVGIRLIGEGQFDDTIDVARADEEVLELIEAFQEMARQLKKYRDNLIETERLKAVNMLATSVSHEVNNPLMIISGTAEYMRTIKGDKDNELKEKMEAIIDEVQRISSITKKLSRIKQIILDDYSLKSSAQPGDGSLVNIEDSAKEKKK